MGVSTGAPVEVDEAGKLSMEGEWREREKELGLEGEGPKPTFKKDLCEEGGEPRNLDLPRTHELLVGATAAIGVASLALLLASEDCCSLILGDFLR